MSIDDIDWSENLGLPNEEALAKSLDCKFNSHTYLLVEAAELMNQGKVGLAWGILYEMLPKTTESKAEKHYLLANIYVMQDKIKKAKKDAAIARKLCPEMYTDFYNRVRKENMRQSKAIKIAKYIVWGIALAAIAIGSYSISKRYEKRSILAER